MLPTLRKLLLVIASAGVTLPLAAADCQSNPSAESCRLVAACRGGGSVDPSDASCEGDSATIVADPCGGDRDLCCLDEPCCPPGSVAAAAGTEGAFDVDCGEGVATCAVTTCACKYPGLVAVDEADCTPDAPCAEHACHDGPTLFCRAP